TSRPAPNTSIVTDIVYTLFTSGSTGRPKGVNVTHLNVLNLVDWAINAFELGPGARVLQYSTINFDASVLDVFPTLL
ncbi:AMP-binding protein, partial [Acinetobacter baumannii]